MNDRSPNDRGGPDWLTLVYGPDWWAAHPPDTEAEGLRAGAKALLSGAGDPTCADLEEAWDIFLNQEAKP